jgi:hypothetical protein
MQKISALILAFVFVVLLSARLSAQQPVILSFQPMFAFSSQTVTIVGQNFVNVTNVRFGGIEAQSFTVNAKGDTIQAVVSNTAYSGLITVVQPTGTTTSATLFTLLGCPLSGTAIFSISPTPLFVGNRDIEVTLRGVFHWGIPNSERVKLSGRSKDTVLIPVQFSPPFVRVTIPTFFVQQPGDLRIRFENTCSSTPATTVTVQAQSPTNVEMSPPIPERIFPNPASDDITLETTLEHPTTLALTITNTLGQHLIRLQQDAPSGLFRTTIPCRQLPPGAYFLEVRSAEKRTLHHLIKN